MQIVAIDKRRYIAGVHWGTVEGGGRINAKQLHAEARKINSMLDGTSNAVFLGRRQYGLVEVPDRKIPILPSLASSIRESGIEDALLKFCLNEEGSLWYVVAISENLLLPEGDSIFTEEDAADEHISEITASYEFELERSFGDAVDSFEFLTSNVSPHLKLKPLHGAPLGKQLGIVSAILILGFGGYQGFQYYQNIKANKESALLFAQQATLKNQKIEAIKNELEVHFPPIYKDKPLAQEVIETCRAKLSEVPINSKGWANSGYACTENTYLAFWKYTDGVSFLKLPLYTKANINDPKEPISLSQVFEHEYTKMGAVELLPQDEAFSRLSEWARLFRGMLTIQWDKPVKKIVGKDTYFEGVEIESPFAIGHWQMTIDETTYLMDLPANTQTVPGLVLSRMEKKEKFFIQGEIYVQSN